MDIPSNILKVRKILILSVPIIFAQLGNVLLGITDTIMVGKVGKAELAAVGLSNQIFFLVTVIGMGIMTALTTLVASSKGAENKKECGEFLRSGIELSLLISLLIFVVLIIISYNFYIFAQPEVINQMAGKYLRIMAVSVFPLLLFLSFKHFNDGISVSKPAMVITFIGVIANVYFNWIFIYGNYTFPAFNTSGAAVATLLTRFLMAFLIVLYVFKSQASKNFLPPLISTYKTGPIIRKLVKIGLPTGFQVFFEVGAYSVAAVFAGWISLAALAAHQIGMGLVAISYMIASGLSAAGSVLVGHSFGRRNGEEIKSIGISSLLTTGMFMVLTSVVFLFMKDEILMVFTNETEVLDIAGTLFLVLVVYQFFNGIQATLTGILRGVHDVFFPAKFTLFSSVNNY
jgi:MATE family multidrug resistance protein